MFIKFDSGFDCVLSRCGASDKKNFVRLDCFFDLFELVHQFFINMKTACCIDNQGVKAFIARLLQTSAYRRDP